MRRLLGTTATRGDLIAVAVLSLLPAVINLPFAFAGEPLMGGDNLSQNFPLRVLAGELIRHGRLPLWNPDIWSGAPLLAGWNAGAMYPGTWLFAVLPGVAAWELNVIAVGVVAGIGLHAFLRRQGCSPAASLLGALTFSYTGFMSGQSVHIGLVTAMALAPWMLIALDAMAAAERAAELARPAALLASAGGLAVLAGDPRGFSNDVIVAALYLIALCWRRRRAGAAVGRLLAGVVTGVLLAVALAAVQWLPGLAFLHQSQRAAARLSFFGLYSLHGGQLAYLFVPFLFGGNGSLGLPTTNFNLPEYTYSAGLLPLVAFFVLAVRAAVRRRRGSVAGPPVVVFLVMVVLGTLLSVGTTTPLGHLLVHLPLYGGERLQNRNMGVVDLGLSVLVAVFLDLFVPAGEGEAETPRLQSPERIAGLLSPVVVIGLIVAMFAATAWTERFLGATVLALHLPVRMAPYYAFAVLVAAGAVAVVARERWRCPRRRRRLALFLVGADVVMFIAMASYQLAPATALAEHNSAVATLVHAGGPAGRDAIFDPQQIPVAAPPHVLDNLGVDDLVVLHHLQSVQGYGSAVSSAYENATGAHEVENLRPAAFLGPTFDILDLTALVTLPELFGTPRRSLGELAVPSGPPRPAGTSVADRQPGDAVDLGSVPPAGPWRLVAGASTTFELGGPRDIDAFAVRVDAGESPGPPPGRLAVAVVLRSGARVTTGVPVHGTLAVSRLPLGVVAAGGGALDLVVTDRSGQTVLRAVAVHVVASNGGVPLTSELPSPQAGWFQLDGLLQGLLPPSRWRYTAHVGPLVLYRNVRADGAAWLQPASPLSRVTTARAAGVVTAPRVAEWQDPVDDVDSRQRTLLVRSEAFAPGWTVTIVPAVTGGGSPGGVPSPVTLPVRAVGLVQGVQLPPGRYVVTWHYRSMRAEVGLAVVAAALVGLGVLVALGRRRPRRAVSPPL